VETDEHFSFLTFINYDSKKLFNIHSSVPPPSSLLPPPSSLLPPPCELKLLAIVKKVSIYNSKTLLTIISIWETFYTAKQT
jgi:hypothetical protein